MSIDFTNKDDIKLFIYDNIELINNSINEFSFSKHSDLKYDSTDIKRFLSKKFIKELKKRRKQKLLKEFRLQDYKKSKIKDIAIANGYYHKDLEGFYQKEFSSEVENILCNSLYNDVLDVILNKTGFSEEKKKYVKTILKNSVEKGLYVGIKNGFTVNINDVEEGIMTANAGDSAQFLFLARAILAGYNCSNVDVRSSRYDAIIDYKGKLFKVQIKGISGSTINFKDRDRGGRGIDTRNARNQGRRITSSDCDIYAAVDKQMGICYIIPMKDADPIAWTKDTMTLKEAEKYRENWNIIDDLL